MVKSRLLVELMDVLRWDITPLYSLAPRTVVEIDLGIWLRLGIRLRRMWLLCGEMRRRVNWLISRLVSPTQLNKLKKKKIKQCYLV